MLLSILQTRWNRESESVESIADPLRDLLRRYHHEESAVYVDRDVDDVVVVVCIPRITRDRIAVGRVMVTLVVGSADGARECLGRIKREIGVCAAKFYGDDMLLPVLQAGRRREVEAVVRLSIYVGQVLTVLSRSYGPYQRAVGIDVNIDDVAGIVGIPRPAADGVTAGAVMRTLQVSGAGALDVLRTAGQSDAGARDLAANG